MIMNGQPITTAEYIQASSRVGRGDVAGIVFANYYKDQARSLSHYENFYPYHQSFYRHVEPTSITPYTLKPVAEHCMQGLSLRCDMVFYPCLAMIRLIHSVPKIQTSKRLLIFIKDFVVRQTLTEQMLLCVILMICVKSGKGMLRGSLPDVFRQNCTTRLRTARAEV